jgi:chromosome partitioning protein
MKTVAIVNQKGGVGKTTTAINLADYYARHGRRVLLVDFDVQGHGARCLGKAKGSGLFRMLVEEARVQDVAIEARPGLDLVTSNKMTEKIRLFMADMISRELYIAQTLEQANRFYDLAVLDLAPGSDLLHIGSLVASDYFLVPAKMDFLALDGVVEVISTVRSLSRIPSVEPPQLIGVLPTMFDRQTNETLENIKRLREAVGADQILPPVPQDVHVREASSRGLTIWEYAPDTPAAIGYRGSGRSVNSRGNVGGYLHLVEIMDAMIW